MRPDPEMAIKDEAYDYMLYGAIYVVQAQVRDDVEHPVHAALSKIMPLPPCRLEEEDE